MYESVRPFKGYKYLHFSCSQLMFSTAHTTKCPQLSVEHVAVGFHRPQNRGRQIYWQPERNIEQWLLRPTFKQAQDYFYRELCDHFTYILRSICWSWPSIYDSNPRVQVRRIRRTTGHLHSTTKKKCQILIIRWRLPVIKFSSVQFSIVHRQSGKSVWNVPARLQQFQVSKFAFKTSLN